MVLTYACLEGTVMNHVYSFFTKKKKEEEEIIDNMNEKVCYWIIVLVSTYGLPLGTLLKSSLLICPESCGSRYTTIAFTDYGVLAA